MRPFKGQTTSKEQGCGEAMAYRVTAPDFALTVLDVRWDNGERDVRGIEVERGRQAIQHLGQGHRRLGVHRLGGNLWVELRIARIDAGTENEWTTVVNASEADWVAIAGATWREDMKETLGVTVGTKASLLGVTDNTRGRLCARIPAGKDVALPRLFVLSRVVPLALGFTRQVR